MKRIGVGAIGVLLSLILFTLPAQADTITYTLGFEELGLLTTVDTEYQGYGVTFSGANLVINLGDTNKVLSCANQLTATFNENVDMVGVNITGSTVVTLTAYYSSGGSQSVSGSPDSYLQLFAPQGESISYVTLHDSGGSFSIDNFAFRDEPSAAVPEPGTLLLLGCGLVGLGLLGRKKFISKA